MDDKKKTLKLFYSYPKYVKGQQVELVELSSFFFAIFCRFDKQKMLVNNKNIKNDTITQIFTQQ